MTKLASTMNESCEQFLAAPRVVFTSMNYVNEVKIPERYPFVFINDMFMKVHE